MPKQKIGKKAARHNAVPASVPPEAAAIRGCPYKALLNTVEIEKAAYKMHAKPLPAPCIPHRPLRCLPSMHAATGAVRKLPTS